MSHLVPYSESMKSYHLSIFLPLEQYKLNWYSCRCDVDISCQIFANLDLPRPDELIRMFSNCGHCFAYPQKLPLIPSDGNCQWPCFKLANSVACISVNLSREINPSTSNSSKNLPCTNFVNAACNASSNSISQDVPFLWFCHDTKKF